MIENPFIPRIFNSLTGNMKDYIIRNCELQGFTV